MTPGEKAAVLDGWQYASLTTYRRSGTPVPTPVWFALEGTTVYVETGPATGKVKRIRHTPRVTLAPCDVRGKPIGPAVEGTARILETDDERRTAQDALGRKYGWTRRLYYTLLRGVSRLMQRAAGDLAYIAIEL